MVPLGPVLKAHTMNRLKIPAQPVLLQLKQARSEARQARKAVQRIPSHGAPMALFQRKLMKGK